MIWLFLSFLVYVILLRYPDVYDIPTKVLETSKTHTAILLGSLLLVIIFQFVFLITSVKFSFWMFLAYPLIYIVIKFVNLVVGMHDFKSEFLADVIMLVLYVCLFAIPYVAFTIISTIIYVAKC